jgi:hypothetical protein
MRDAQILLIHSSQAEDFLQKKKSDADQKCSQIKTDMRKLQSEINEPSNSYTNDPRYTQLIQKANEDIKMAQTMANAIGHLRSKYGESPYSMNMPLVRQYPKEYYDAWHAEDADAGRIESIRLDANRLDNEMDSTVAAIKAKKEQQKINATVILNSDDQLLNSYQSPRFYLSDFCPVPLETLQADDEGRFAIHNTREGTRVFAKVMPDNNDTNEEFFWLVDLPPVGQKLILNDGNLFNPTNAFTSP